MHRRPSTARFPARLCPAAAAAAFCPGPHLPACLAAAAQPHARCPAPALAPSTPPPARTPRAALPRAALAHAPGRGALLPRAHTPPPLAAVRRLCTRQLPHWPARPARCAAARCHALRLPVPGRRAPPARLCASSRPCPAPPALHRAARRRHPRRTRRSKPRRHQEDADAAVHAWRKPSPSVRHPSPPPPPDARTRRSPASTATPPGTSTPPRRSRRSKLNREPPPSSTPPSTCSTKCPSDPSGPRILEDSDDFEDLDVDYVEEEIGYHTPGSRPTDLNTY
ncbi:serine/arginine repetitive matrix protein 1-like [Panicum virgatum]|uniref:serine/arginine repetitive matrix protein 1-like n=1 Tax=Panicum virgatum TaxID=38727 RepID=UPI0019D4FE11|nr:serine/arginine repetitive matrix protein 1-like [Panicum virgatum]